MLNAKPNPRNVALRPPPRRKRSLVRRALFILAMVPLLAGGLSWIVTRSWFMIAAITPALEARLGGEVGISGITYKGDGTFIIEDLRVRVPGMQGLGAEVAHIAELHLNVDVGKLFTGEIEILAARVDGLHLRSSENLNKPGEYNFMLLEHEWDRDAHESTRLPRIEITSAIVETGVHEGAEYHVIGQRRVAGQMHRLSKNDSTFSFELGEIDEHGNGLGESGLVIHGQWNSETFEYGGRIDGLRLDDQARRMCPQMARVYWDRMDLEGTVGSASIEYKPGEPLVAELIAENVGVTMPVDVEGLWSLYRAGEMFDTNARPRMLAHNLSLRIQGDRMELNAYGTQPNQPSVSMPFNVKLVIPELPKLEWSQRELWLDQMLATLPFEMQLRIDDFRFDPEVEGLDASLELPTAVARMFALFEMTGWQLSTEIDVSRGPATLVDGTPTAATIQSNGRAFIRHASGRYRRFPYQLTDVEAYIEFNNDRALVHYLNGRGSDEATVRLSGTIAPPNRNGAVDLRIDAADVPLDGRLRAALLGQAGEMFDVLFDEEALQRVRAANEQTQAMAAGFELGGLVDLNLNVRRDEGQGKRAVITGLVDVQRAGFVYEKFPYPMTITGGTLDWQEDAVTIGSTSDQRGLTLETIGGGKGVLSGRVELQRQEDGAIEGRPNLTLTMAGDSINPMLLAAIPSEEGTVDTPGSESRGTAEASGSESRGTGAASLMSSGRATRLLHGLGLTATLDCTGDIVALPSGAMHYDFVVGLKDGAAVPMPDVSSVMAELGLRWPEGFSLSDVSGVVRVSPGEIGLVDLTGRRGEGTVTASGTLDLSGTGPAELHVQFKSLALEQYLVNLAPAGGVQRAQELWDRYQPQGTFDADLRYRAEAGEPGVAEITVQPNLLRITAAGQPLAMYRTDGLIVLHGDEVRFENLELELQTGSREDGVLTLDGSYGASVHGELLSVTGAWQQGMFESPLIPELMRLVGAKREAERYEALMPSGSFDSVFSYRSPQGAAPASYKFEMQPSSLALVLDGTVLSAALEPSSRVTFTPGLVEFADLEGECSGGEFRVDGQMTIAAAPMLELNLEYRGDLVSQHVWAMLPREVRNAMRDIRFHSSEAGRVSDATLRLARAAESDEWSMTFAGLIETGSCAFDVGIPFRDVDGAFRIDAHRPAGGPAEVEVKATANSLRVLEREMTNLTADMLYSQETQELTIHELRGELYGGVLTAEAKVGTGSRRDYAMRLVTTGVSLDEIARAESLGANDAEIAKLVATHDLRPPSESEEAASEARASGELFASLDLAGERGEAYTRSGRGTLRVVGGEVANLSLALRVLQMMQFVPPFADTMDYAEVDYYVAGDRVVFEQILLEIPFMERAALQLLGEGEMDFNTFELSTRFRSRGTIPMLSDIVGGLSDRLYQIEVTGPITNPVARVLALPDLKQRDKSSNSVRVPAAAKRVVQEPVS